jgi:hypothetical protein
VDPNATLLQPPTPIFRSENWPQLAVVQSAVSNLGGDAAKGIADMNLGDDYYDAGEGGDWGDDEDLFDEEGGEGEKKSAPKEKGEGWEEDDLDLSDDDLPASPKGSQEVTRNADGSMFTMPSAGNPPPLAWCADSSHCADHFAAGSADSAVQLLNRQVRLVCG